MKLYVFLYENIERVHVCGYESLCVIADLYAQLSANQVNFKQVTITINHNYNWEFFSIVLNIRVFRRFVAFSVFITTYMNTFI